jgi:hypothetical protein
MIDLTSARLKIERAKSHLTDAMALLQIWKETDGYKLIWGSDPELALDGWFLRVETLPDDEFSLCVADFLSNAQSALDHVAWQIFVAGGGSSAHPKALGVYFPILPYTGDKAGDDAWQKLLKRKLPTAWPEAAIALRSEQDDREPNPDNMLFMLGKLANSQKHRNLHATVLAPNRSSNFTWPALPDGYTYSPSFSMGSQTLEPDSTYSIVEFAVLAMRDPATSPVPRSEVERLPDQPMPKFEFGLTDSEYSIELNQLRAMGSRVSRIIETASKLDLPGQSTSDRF